MSIPPLPTTCLEMPNNLITNRLDNFLSYKRGNDHEMGTGSKIKQALSRLAVRCYGS